MSTFDLTVLLLTLVMAAVGAWSIYLARAEPSENRSRGGRILFVLNLLALGGTGLTAAFARAHGLSPLGLVAGLLIIGMLWERGPAKAHPRPTVHQHIPPDGQGS